MLCKQVYLEVRLERRPVGRQGVLVVDRRVVLLVGRMGHLRSGDNTGKSF